MMLSLRMVQSLADARLRMLLLPPDSSQDRKDGRNEQLFSGDVERIVHERGEVLVDAPDLLAHGVDRELEIARIIMNGLLAVLRSSKAISISGPGRDLPANKSTIAAIAKSAMATTVAAQIIPIEVCSAL